MGGCVQSSSVRTDDTTGGGGTFELRVRVSRLDRTVAELSRLAHVVERTQDAQDITAPYVSARTRLRDARAERAGLLRQLANAQTLDETERIRASLRLVNRRIVGARA